jgi:hypothetical protein
MNSSALFILTLKVAAGALVLIIAACGFVLSHAARSPKGYEDEDGFHLDPVPLPRLNAKRGNRAVIPTVEHEVFGKVRHHHWFGSPSDLGPER